MNREILMAVDAVSNEKGVDKEIIFDALEAALASATRKKHGEELDVRVSINRKTGDYDTFQRWKVFADDSTELEVPQRELRLDDARDIDKDVEPGGYVEQPMESVPFGRILAQTAKQVIVQKVREAERAQVVDAYKDRAGTLVSGIVKRVDRNGVFVDLGANAEGIRTARGDDSARTGAFAGSDQGIPEGGSFRTARAAVVHVAYRARIFDRAVQARGARGRPGFDQHPRRRARRRRARQDRGAQ